MDDSKAFDGMVSEDRISVKDCQVMCQNHTNCTFWMQSEELYACFFFAEKNSTQDMEGFTIGPKYCPGTLHPIWL